MHVVSLHTVLRNLLYHEDIRTSIKTHLNNKRRSNNTDKLYDLVYKLSSQDKIDIPIILYLDEFEPCNPIGSRRKIHKLTAIYFTIGSLPIQLRTLLKSGFL